VFSGIADEGVVRNLARAPWPYREQDAQNFASLPRDPLAPRFLITDASNGGILGCIGIDPVEGERGAIEIGYWIARLHWGKGFATEAGQSALKIASALGYAQAVASHFLDNPASGRVLEKIGFEPTGRIVEAHSCGRGEKALTAEYSLDLAGHSASFGARAA